VELALHANHELVHVYEYQGVFSGIVTDKRKENPDLHRQIKEGVADNDTACKKKKKIDAKCLTHY
jgi:hypothetical protein